jgi:tetratricopeptide (TPR) repeat protein
MNEYEQRLPTEAQFALERCFTQIRLARATELAQSGRYLEAEAVLVRNGGLPDNPHELDLLARIAARQGRFDEARQYWNAALLKEPGNEIYRECMEHLTLARRISLLVANSQDILLSILGWATIAFGIGALIFTFYFK